MSRAFRLLIIAVLAVAVFGVFGVLVWLVLGQGGPAPALEVPVPTPALVPLNARQAFERAQQVARNWQLDAVLTAVSTNWHAARLEDLGDDASAWVVTFYSPSTGEKRSIEVSSGSAHAAAPSRPRNLPPVIDLSHWQVDSQGALALFLGHGGQEFVAAHQPVDVFLILNLSETGQLQWIALALDSTGSQSHSVVIDARTGNIDSMSSEE